VKKLAALLERLPQHELAIHRLCASDPVFGSICEDYEEAQAALRHWRYAASADAVKAEHYQHLVAELEAEILEGLEHARRRPSSGP
jgi:hypothetical protein